MKLSNTDSLPAELEPHFDQVVARVAELDTELPAPLAESAARVLVASQFVLDTLLRQPEALLERLQDPEPLASAGIAARVCVADATENEAMRTLRRVRNVELAAIAWRDIAGLADLDRTLADLSELADGLIAGALATAVALLEPRYGQPSEMLVLGMGKLGGHELNFSSDVDLILLYPDPGESDDLDAIQAYCLKLAQRLIRLLDARTADGIVYRVDTRLRPFGQSGPLVLSVSALESYLVQHGRDWERYAYIKARLIGAADSESGATHDVDVFDHVLTPFIYRRYLDFGVFDSLRQMKRLISEEVVRRDRHDNIKLGRGGIREVEFIAQLFQLVHGGQDPALRVRPLQSVLAELSRQAIVEPARIEQLLSAYRFLRTAENRLQALDDQQTHDIPKEAEVRARWAWSMGLPQWNELAAELEAQREIVQDVFDEIGWESAGDQPDTAADDSLLTAWDAGRLAATTNGEFLEPLDRLHQSGLYQRMDETSRQRLRSFVVELVRALESQDEPGRALDRIVPIIQAICRRSAYLSLLLENPAALNRLLGLAAQSAMLARLVAEHPLLLDELLDPRLFDTPPTHDELEASFRRQLDRVRADDIEGLLNAMRDFQRAAMFRVAIADRFGGLPLMQVSDRLTDIAELVLAFALDTAGAELSQRHGLPMHGSESNLEESGLVVVAYGKLGGLELGYGSDLDVVFLHDSAGEVQETNGPQVIDCQRYFVRVVQRLIHILSVQTSSGRLYEIDTRLRPSGASGLMVATLASFERYQREEAWTWEHQALLRSRSVAGPPALRDEFERIRIKTLTDAVNRETLRAEVAKMRRRMRAELAASKRGEFDIKQDPGGLADIEFLVDYWVLANADSEPALVRYPDNIRQLEALAAAGLITPELAESICEDYVALRAKTHELALADGGKCVPDEEFRDLRERITGLWQDTFGDSEQ